MLLLRGELFASGSCMYDEYGSEYPYFLEAVVEGEKPIIL
jgi:hypothetical protein